MKLAAVRVHALHASFADTFGGIDRVPPSLRRPASHFQKIERLGQYATLVEIESEDGFVGWGEAFGLPHPMMSASLLESVIVPAMRGTMVDDPVAATADLHAFFAALGHTRGAAPEALSAVDIALWDLNARRAGLPLSTMLGGTPGAVAAYVGSVPFLDTPSQSAERAVAFAGEGYAGIKLKVGRGAATDAAHAAAVRNAIGPSLDLMLDANTAYDCRTAIEVARAVAPFNVAWLEEPIPPDDPGRLAIVRAASPVPIAAGENEFSFSQFRRLAEAGAVDVLQPNVTRAGGVSGLMALDALCIEHGLALAPHGVGSAIGVAAAVNACRAAGSFRVYEANRLLNPLRDDLPIVPVLFRAGAFEALNAHGHGVVPNPELLRRYALEPGRRPAVHAVA